MYVREVKYFLGDIPEKNIKDLMDFEVCLDDVIIFNPKQHYRDDFKYRDISQYLYKKSEQKQEYWIKISDFKELGLDRRITIAAVENLFHKEAFAKSKDRIEGSAELEAKNKVELDPIILFETNDGYLIITAWGDEANDEIVINEKLN